MQKAPIHQSHAYWRIKILQTIFEKGHPRNILLELFQNLISSFREDFLRISSMSIQCKKPAFTRVMFMEGSKFRQEFWKASPKKHSCLWNYFKIGPAVPQEKIFQQLLKKIQFRCHGNQSFRWNQILWTLFKEDLLSNIPAKFGPDWISGFGGEDRRRTQDHPKSSPWTCCAQVS